MAELTNAERELHLNMAADDRSVWEVFTDDPVWIARLDKIAVAYKTSAIGKWYKLTAGQVSIKRERSPMTEEQRKVATERLAKARANR